MNSKEYSVKLSCDKCIGELDPPMQLMVLHFHLTRCKRMESHHIQNSLRPGGVYSSEDVSVKMSLLLRSVPSLPCPALPLHNHDMTLPLTYQDQIPQNARGWLIVAFPANDKDGCKKMSQQGLRLLSLHRSFKGMRSEKGGE